MLHTTTATPLEHTPHTTNHHHQVGHRLQLIDVSIHKVQPRPPSRYTEAGLIKALTSLGIGRPSTYASVLTTLQERKYVRRIKGRLVPTPLARIVVPFLVSYFPRYMEYGFTAGMERSLDDIAGGLRDWKGLVQEEASTLEGYTDAVMQQRQSVVLDTLFASLQEYYMPVCGVERWWCGEVVVWRGGGVLPLQSIH